MSTVHKAKPIAVTNVDELPDNPFARLNYEDIAEDNLTRAHFAIPAVKAFAKRTGLGGEDVSTAISDLLADLHHLADALDLDWDALVERGDRHYQPELRGEL